MPIETPLDDLVAEICKKGHERKWLEMRNKPQGIAMSAVVCHVKECIFARNGLNLLCAHPWLFDNWGYHTKVLRCINSILSLHHQNSLREEYMILYRLIRKIDEFQRLSCGGYSTVNDEKMILAIESLDKNDPLKKVLWLMEGYVDSMLIGGLKNEERPWPSAMYEVSEKKRAEFDMLIETAEWIIGQRMQTVIWKIRSHYLVSLASMPF